MVVGTPRPPTSTGGWPLVWPAAPLEGCGPAPPAAGGGCVGMARCCRWWRRPCVDRPPTRRVGAAGRPATPFSSSAPPPLPPRPLVRDTPAAPSFVPRRKRKSHRRAPVEVPQSWLPRGPPTGVVWGLRPVGPAAAAGSVAASPHLEGGEAAWQQPPAHDLRTSPSPPLVRRWPSVQRSWRPGTWTPRTWALLLHG